MPADPKFYDAYDKRTGKKLPHKVPGSHFAIFPYLSKTPRARAAKREHVPEHLAIVPNVSTGELAPIINESEG